MADHSGIKELHLRKLCLYYVVKQLKTFSCLGLFHKTYMEPRLGIAKTQQTSMCWCHLCFWNVTYIHVSFFKESVSLINNYYVRHLEHILRLKRRLKRYDYDLYLNLCIHIYLYLQDIVKRGLSLNSLLDMTVEELKNLLKRYEAKEDDFHKLNNALQNLKNWTGKNTLKDTLA